MQQHREAVTAKSVYSKLQKVHRLGAGKYSTAAENGICPEKSADRGKGQMPVKIGIIIDKQYDRPISIRIVQNEQM